MRWRSGAGGAAVSGPCAAGACGGTAGGAAAGEATAGAAGGAGAGRLLLTSRDERGGASVSGAVGAAAAAAGGAATVRVGAFLSGAVLGAVELDEEATAFLGAAAGPPAAAAGAGTADGAEADVVALVAFLAGAGSSGWTGRRKPSASALRRTRSACASSMEDEWLLTPIPRERASSSPSLLVRPSSLASS